MVGRPGHVEEVVTSEEIRNQRADIVFLFEHTWPSFLPFSDLPLKGPHSQSSTPV